SNLLAYLRHLAYHDGLKDKIRGSFLGRQYEDLDFVPDDSVLAFCFKGDVPEEADPSSGTIYYPFGFNLSQKKAVENAFLRKISIIEGPPGTGKTQTILNLLANIVMRGQTAAVVSGNNSATHNIEEKLRKYGVDFLCAFLGSRENRDAFLAAPKPLPDMTDWGLEPKAKMALKERLAILSSELNEALEMRNRIAALHEECAALRTEQTHFLAGFPAAESLEKADSAFDRLDSSEVLALLASCEAEFEKRSSLSFWKRILVFFRFGVWDGGFFRKSPAEIGILLRKLFYTLRLAEVTQESAALEAKLEGWDFKNKTDEYADGSMRLFRDAVAE
ncbi:MAG: AAA family ATPase, partial [Mailhella sp.]|nr:AAA family ATPase [Mailhella sp.]